MRSSQWRLISNRLRHRSWLYLARDWLAQTSARDIWLRALTTKGCPTKKRSPVLLCLVVFTLSGIFVSVTLNARHLPKLRYQRRLLHWSFISVTCTRTLLIQTGSGTPKQAFAYARQTGNLDFMAVTEHNHAAAGPTSGEPREKWSWTSVSCSTAVPIQPSFGVRQFVVTKVRLTGLAGGENEKPRASECAGFWWKLEYPPRLFSSFLRGASLP